MYGAVNYYNLLEIKKMGETTISRSWVGTEKVVNVRFLRVRVIGVLFHFQQ
jgi:hypothetical protein